MTQTDPAIVHPTNGPIHSWFSLSYSNYQVVPRTLAQSMPIEWQERMVACFEELQAAYEHIDQPEVYEVTAGTEHIVNEMSDDELAAAGITDDWYDEEQPEGLDGDALLEWQADHERDRPVYYDRDGNELDPGTRVIIPCADPIPHYRHAYIPPRLPTQTREVQS